VQQRNQPEHSDTTILHEKVVKEKVVTLPAAAIELEEKLEADRQSSETKQRRKPYEPLTFQHSVPAYGDAQECFHTTMVSQEHMPAYGKV